MHANTARKCGTVFSIGYQMQGFVRYPLFSRKPVEICKNGSNKSFNSSCVLESLELLELSRRETI